MYGISESIQLIEGAVSSVLVDFRRYDVFTLNQQDSKVLRPLIDTKFFNAEQVPNEVLEFLIENRMVFEFPSGLEHLFPKTQEAYYSKVLIEVITLEYSPEVNLHRVFKLCQTLRTPCLVIQSQIDIQELLQQELDSSPYPESVTLVTSNKAILAKEPVFRLVVEKKSDQPFVCREHINSDHSLYLESLHRHSYFNQKLHIETNGNLKNTPETDWVIGNLNDNKVLEELPSRIAQSEFQRYWKVTKDSCDVCKDCEFRYMCVDNRLPIKRNSNEWFHASECNYNPYLGKWLGEEGYSSLSECGIISDEHGFHIENTLQKASTEQED